MDGAKANTDPRHCTCHPDDLRPVPCTERYALRDCQIVALASAMWQLLDDFGATGSSACMAAVAQARIAYEPFNDHECEPPMTMEQARAIIAQADY